MSVVNVAEVEVVEEADEALTLADLDTRDPHHLEDVHPIVLHLLVAKPTRTSQVVKPEVARVTADDLQPDP